MILNVENFVVKIGFVSFQTPRESSDHGMTSANSGGTRGIKQLGGYCVSADVQHMTLNQLSTSNSSMAIVIDSGTIFSGILHHKDYT